MDMHLGHLPWRGRGSGNDGTGNLGVAPMPVHWLDTTPVESDDKPCELQSLEVQAKVRGVFAEVVQTLVLFNPNRRPIAASIVIPLPDRATVCGYALDIDGQMVDGVVVPKDEARVIFETEQRRGVDPGLVEAVRGNVYRTRVYPVSACHTRTVRLRYIAPLLLGADGSATLDLPMPCEHLTKRVLCIDVEPLDGTAPIIDGLAGAEIEQSGRDWGVRTEERDLTPTEAIRVVVPTLPSSFALLESDAYGTVWFCASDEAPARNPKDTPDTPPLTQLTVLWDTSGSRAAQDHTRELELLHAYASAESVSSLTLVPFADHVHEVQHPASADELVECVGHLAYDGGTNLMELACALPELGLADARAQSGNACVLFSDGLDTLCDETFSLPDTLDVMAVVSGNERDAEALRQGCHGLSLDLSQAPRDAEELMQTICEHGLNGLKVAGHGIANVCDAGFPRSSRRVAIGRLTTDQTTITLGRDSTPIVLRAADARRGKMLASAWASRRVAMLSPRARDNADELLRLGRRHGVVSPVTSLLVLETLEQWLRYDIKPPRTLASMRRAWLRGRLGRMQHSTEEAEDEGHRRALARSWEELKTWWERDPKEAAEVAYGIRGVWPCPSCGTRIIPGLRFCPTCGTLVRPHRPRAIQDDGPAAVLSDSSYPDMPLDASLIEESFFALPTSAESFDDDDNLADGFFSSEPDSAASSYHLSGEERLLRSISSVPDERDAGGSQSTPTASVSVRPWMPDAPYLKVLDRAFDSQDAQAARAAYHAQRQEYRRSPSFFLDCAGWFIAHDDEDFGVSVLTNLAELRIEDAALLRIMAWRLREAGRLEQALVILRRVLRLREEDSQSHRDLALVLTELAREAYATGRQDAARAYAEEAGTFYRKITLTNWQRRPMAIGLFAVEEYNVLRAWADAQTWETAPDLPSLGDDLEGVLDCDLRITLAWDADETDVDLHVTEPSGEEAYFAHNRTSKGGRVSEDIIDGYGPELYEIRKAPEGIYTIRAHYYASHQQTVFGPATCTLTAYTNWGRETQEQAITSMRLEKAREMVNVGTVTWGNAPVANDDETTEDLPVPPERRIELGMSPRDVADIMGFPNSISGSGLDVCLSWELAGERKLEVQLSDDKVVRVSERTPWGDEMVILQ